MLSLSNLEQSVTEKINLGVQLIKSTESMENLEGLPKLQRKINQELKFLKKVYLK